MIDSRRRGCNRALQWPGCNPALHAHFMEGRLPRRPLLHRQIVAELKAERKLVEANRELIARMEAKIKAKLAEVWGE